MARMVASMLATDALLSKMPGARRMSPSRVTDTSVSWGWTVSMWAANTMVGPPPVPRRMPVTFPMESVITSRPSASIWART